MEARFFDLIEAVQNGKVDFRAWAKNSYSETQISLMNKTSLPLEIDFSRSVLISKTGKSQRIGLSHPVGKKSGEYTLGLKPKERLDIVFKSRCLDIHRAPPNNGTEYTLIPELLPNFVVDALRQGIDQAEVWNITNDRNDDMPDLTPGPETDRGDDQLTPPPISPNDLSNDAPALAPIPAMVDKL